MARCQKPITLRNRKNMQGNVVPCGKCENCKKNRVSNWSFRLMQEEKRSLSAYFITLTYDCDRVPITRNGFMDLSCRDLQLFFKRLRRAHDRSGIVGVPLKYYAVGEYGGKYMRPHYHIILFNAELSVLIGGKLARGVRNGTIKLDGKRPFICDSWSHHKTDTPIGHITIGQVSEASVGYTMKYVSKPSKVPVHRNDDRTPEFSKMSKQLGIGYLTDAMISWHKSDMENRQYCTLRDGKKVCLPRYYKDKMLSLQEKECLRAINMLENLKPKQRENTARERSEAFYAGLDRMAANVSKNQTF